MNIPGLRSPHDTVGGVVHFGRMLDKIRLRADGQLPSDYEPNLGKGFDGRVCAFLRVEYPAVVARVRSGGTDKEILAWCFASGRQPAPDEIEMFNAWLSKRGWRDELSARLAERKQQDGMANRTDVQCFFDLIDADEERPLSP